MSNTSEKVHNFIVKHIKDKTYPPTIREIQLAVGLLSSSTAQGHVERLAKKGLITFIAGRPRTIKLVEEPNEPSTVKVLTSENGFPTAIEWNSRNYVFDPAGVK